MEQKDNLEASFLQLEEIIKKMEQTDATLEESFDLYNQGIKLVKTCNDKIDKVEKQLLVLNDEKAD